MTDWRVFEGTNKPHDGVNHMPDPPPWRPMRAQAPMADRIIPMDDQLSPKTRHIGLTYQSAPEIIDMVNAALLLRRPLLVTGKPGSGKSSLIDAVAFELRLGEPLRWPIGSNSNLQDALYRYDAIGRLQDAQRGGAAEKPISGYLRLGPLGTALVPTRRPRALLIDEIDKSDIDLPNDLLNVLEEGVFEIPELNRLPEDDHQLRLHGQAGGLAVVHKGQVAVHQFPFVVMTSNGERDFPQAFLRRCLRLDMPDPCADPERLAAVVGAHLKAYLEARPLYAGKVDASIQAFAERAQRGEALATDQLLNLIFMLAGPVGDRDHDAVSQAVTRRLD